MVSHSLSTVGNGKARTARLAGAEWGFRGPRAAFAGVRAKPRLGKGPVKNKFAFSWASRRPAGKARGGSIRAVFDRQVTPPDGMDRRPKT